MTASKVVAIAVSQIGVTESPKNSNKTKYGKAFGMNGVPWCAIFIWWCFNKAGAGKLFPHNASAAYAQDEIVSRCGGKWIMKKNTRKDTRKAYLAKAKPGDIVTFDFGRMNAYRQHIGIVERVSGQYLICIEGNTSKSGSQSNGGMVCRQRRIYTSVCAAARPKYIGSDKLEPLEVDGVMGYETICRLQRLLKVTEDGEIGPITTKAWQKKIGMSKKDQDGDWGTKTWTATQHYLTTEGFPVMVTGKKDKATIKAMQKFLNKKVTK